MGMTAFPVGGDNACLHFSLFCLTHFEQESTHQLAVCLTTPATAEETVPCPTSCGTVHMSHTFALADWRRASRRLRLSEHI